MIELDGSAGEGGGQILRTGLALAMCNGQPLRIHSIRAKRSKPGLMRQHLSCVQAAQAVSGAVVSGAELGSSSLLFEPGAVRAGDYRFAVGTAGSCTLVLQTVMPALMRAGAPSRVELSGGTHNPMAPPFHFIQRSFAPLLKRMGGDLALMLRRHGFYPAGGGEAVAVITPPANGLQPFDLLHRGPLREAYAECLAPGLPRGVAARELNALGAAMGWAPDQLRTPAVRQEEGPGNALMVTLAYEQVTELVTGFGEKGRSAESVAASVAAELRAFQSGTGAVGLHLADQLALPLALAVHDSGRAATYSFTGLTEHTRTNFQVIEAFLPVRCKLERFDRDGWQVKIH